MAGQIQCYLDSNFCPLGFGTWAWITEDSGAALFFNDWVTDRSAFKVAMKHMTCEKFPNEIASSLRRANDGSIRRVNRWIGVNVKSR